MLGLRPQLKHRPSTHVERIIGRALDELPFSYSTDPGLGDELIDSIDYDYVPSPSARHFAFPQPLNHLESSVRTVRRTMPAAKAQKGADGEEEQQTGSIYSISGPVVTAQDMIGVSMYELVKVGYDELSGEVIRIEGDKATIQVYVSCKLPVSTHIY